MALQHPFEKVSVIGLGYIGLPTAALLAARGLEVVGVDVSERIVNTINRGEIHIVEPGLDVIVRGAVQLKKLKAVLTPEPAEVFVIAVPTPFKENYEPDLSYVEAAARSIAPVLRSGNLVILESTSPVGTTEKIRAWLSEERPDLRFPQVDSSGSKISKDSSAEKADVFLAYCPERVLPGKVVEELVSNDRVVGGITEICSQRAIEFYKIFVSGNCYPTQANTAEMVKLTENAFRDVNIAFANELSMICEKLNISVWELIRLANKHPRVQILNPGPGVGGHCISIDPWFIIHQNPEKSQLMKMARKVNISKVDFVVEKIKIEAMKKQLDQICFWGLSFKADIDDLRESPAVEIVGACAKEPTYQKIFVVEPYVEALPNALISQGHISLVTQQQALNNSGQKMLHVLLVDHRSFREITKNQLETISFLDFKGVWEN